MPFFSRTSDSEKEYDTSDGSSHDFDERNQVASQSFEESDNEESPEESSKFCTKCRCAVVSILVVVGATIGISLITTNDPNPLNFFIPVDPPGAEEATRWDASKGLFLTVEVATDDVWAPVVEQSILDWNQSEAVILRTSRIPHDPTCSPSSRRLKICNDDYGETPWHGINVILQDQLTNTTIHSISKLNDRYNTNNAERVYIACHENGHGLGLPHTDEDHYNRDRGDCMDYTIRPQNNGVPGDHNLNLLEVLYGTPNRPLGSETDGAGGSSVGSVAGSTSGSNSGWPDIPDFSNQTTTEKKTRTKRKTRRKTKMIAAEPCCAEGWMTI